MTQLSSIKILVLGAKCVGKSAITVRFLTKRYIGEYKSNTDWFYQQNVKTEDGIARVEILDISRDSTKIEKFEDKDQIEWAEAYVIIYSICDRQSFLLAHQYLKTITEIRGPVYVPIVLLANKTDLEVGREVSLEEGTTLALKFGSQFYEISAADSNLGVCQAFEWLLHQSHKHNCRTQTTLITHRTQSHRKLSIITVSRVFSAFGHVFGKSHNNNHNNNSDNNNNDRNGNSVRHKNQTNYALNTRKKIANVMIPVVRRSTKPVISL